MSEPKLVPTACACCGQVKEAREYRISHKHHKDFRYIGADGKVKYHPDTWSSECRACRRRADAKMRARLKADNTRLLSGLTRRAEVQDTRTMEKKEAEMLLSRMKLARSQYLKAVRVDKQQLKRMDRNEHPTKKTENARRVRLDKIARVKAQYRQQVLDIQAGRRARPLDLSGD